MNSINDISEKILANKFLDIKIGDSDAIRTALEMAKNGERVACSALGVFGDSSAVDPLIHLLRTGSATSRQDAADSLGCIGDAKAIDAILDALRHEYVGDRDSAGVYYGASTMVDMDKYVRSNMVCTLGRFGDERALEILKKALNDSEESVQKDAQWAIEYIGASYPRTMVVDEIESPVEEDIPILIETLKNITEYEYLKGSDLPDKLKFYQNSSFILRNRFVFRAIRALKKLGNMAIDPLLQASKSVKKSAFSTDYFGLAIKEIQNAQLDIT